MGLQLSGSVQLDGNLLVTGSSHNIIGNTTISGSLFISGSGGNPSQAIQIIRDTVGNGTSVEESNMAFTILSATGQTKLAMGASNAGNYGYIQVMQDATSFTNRVLTLQPRGGDVSITNGNLIIGTAGKGIDFSADGNAGGMTSELLDDYEEGTWTMGISFGGASVGVTTSANTGTYTKIGRQVTVNGFLILTSKGSSSGTALITGLPFTVGNSDANFSTASLRFANISFANQYQGFGRSNTTSIDIEETTEAGATTIITNDNFANNSNLIVSLTYFV